MEEIWKPCIENYEISNMGNCRRKMNNGNYKLVAGSIQNKGYRYFQQNRNGKRNNYFFHQLVAEQFLGERPKGLVTDHIDRNKLNNNVSNLRYVTQAENMRNVDKYITEITELDPEKRRVMVSKRYNELNRENIIAKKREYYKKNKEILLEKAKNKKGANIICSICKNERQVSYAMYNSIKKKGEINNICRKCSAIQNLNKISK